MLNPEIIEFLNELKQNNNKEWFALNKSKYDRAKLSFETFVHKLILEISGFDKDIKHLEPKDCTFRIYRDTRFSHNKAPYKTNFGAYIVKGGKKSGYAGYYFHVEPPEYFFSGGLYLPQSKVLNQVRHAIYSQTNEFLEIINEKQFKKIFKDIWGEKLKSAPKGFSKDWEHIELLKYKSYVSLCNVSEDIVLSDKLMQVLSEGFNATYNFNCFFNETIDFMNS